MKLPHINIDSSNPKKTFEIFSSTVGKPLKKADIDENSRTFSYLIHEIGDVYVKQNQVDTFNRKSQRLAEQLVGLGNGSFAGIIYSFLIKLNKNNPKIVEELATNGLAIAKRFKDPVHIMARAENLRQIYQIKAPDSDKYLQILYTEKRALSDICKDYDSAKKRFKTLKTEMKPIENYEQMLTSVKIELGKALINKDPNNARYELESAREIISKYGKGKYTENIKILLTQLDKSGN